MKLVARPSGPLSGVACIPGDKSCSHRALIIGAMAEGVTRITGLLQSEDVFVTLNAIRNLGAEVEQDGDAWLVRGGPWRSASTIDCGNSGTTARLLMGAVAGMPGVRAQFSGDASLSVRPMQRVTFPLSRMGATVQGGDRLPLTIAGAALGGASQLVPSPRSLVPDPRSPVPFHRSAATRAPRRTFPGKAGCCRLSANVLWVAVKLSQHRSTTHG